MKNKEIEELLNKIKKSIKTHKKLNLDDDMLVVLEFDVIQWNLLLSYIEQLKEDYSNELEENYKLSEWLVKKQKKIEQLENRNKELYEGFMGMSDERCEYAIKCEQLENNRDKAIELIEEKLKVLYHQPDRTPYENVIKILKGDSDD